MINEVAETLRSEGVDQIPDTERLLQAVNRSKDEAVAILEQIDASDFVVTATYSVSQGASGITLPDGYTSAAGLGITNPSGTPPAFRRLVSVTRTDLGYDIDVPIIDVQDRHSGYAATGKFGNSPVMYREGNALKFDSESGAFTSMTLVLRYAAQVPDLDGTDNSARFTLYPQEWDDIIVKRAILSLLPARLEQARAKFSEMLRERIAQLQASRQKRTHYGPALLRTPLETAGTIGQLINEVIDNLRFEGVDKPPETERILRALNRAKDEMVAVLESEDQNEFVTTATYSVSQGDTSITLPDGYTSAASLNITDPSGTPPAFRRLIGLTRTDLGYDLDVPVIDIRDRHSGYSFTGNTGDAPILYRQGNTLRFDSESGAFTAMTLVLRYAAQVADLDGTDETARYDLFPQEWLDLIVNRATLMLMPASLAQARAKFAEVLRDRLAQLRVSRQRQIHDGPAFVRAEWDLPRYEVWY